MWILGFISTSLGISVGGSVAWILKGFRKHFDLIYAFCAGLILCLISIEILPESIEMGSWIFSFVGVSIGIITYEVLHKLLELNKAKKKILKKNMYIRTGLLIMISIAIHNLPMGIILGENQDDDFTFTLLQALFFHSIPEGIILFTPLISVGMNIFILLFISILVSTPVAMGVYIGGYISLGYQILSSILISFTAGMILMVTIKEIILPSLKLNSTRRILLFTFLGMMIMGIYLNLI